MKKLLFLSILMLLPMLASAQTASDVQYSGCQNETRGDETQKVPTIILTKEGSVLSVQMLNYESNCCTEDFNVTSSIRKDGDYDEATWSTVSGWWVFINVEPVGEDCDCVCPFNVSFTIRDLESNSFYLDCWWYRGYLELTEGEPYVMAIIDDIYYHLFPSINEAEVIQVLNYPSNYTGNVEIPEKVVCNGTEYRVTSIQKSAFSGCRELTSVTIPNSITKIEETTFANCLGLTSVNIPNSVTSIGEHAFYNCKELTSVSIPNNVTEIQNSAFRDCSSLTSITIPNNVAIIEEGAFAGCSNLRSIVVEEGNTVYDSRERCNAIIKTSDNELIVGCMNTTIPNSVTAIGSLAFFNCIKLTNITIPNGVTKIDSYAFQECSELTSVTIPGSVTEIGENAFIRCRKLRSLTIHDGVIVIGNGAFAGCRSLNSFIIPNSVTTIGEGAFDACESLTSIAIPNKVTSIGSYSFAGCKSLTSATIPNSVTKIGYKAFDHCSSLTSIIIPNSVTEIGMDAFSSCSSLTSVIISNNITSINCFSNCSSLTSVFIPKSVTTIGSYAFQNCSGLTSITIPNSVTEIGDYAFYNCSNATSVTIGNKVDSLGYGTFGECKKLLDVYCSSERVPEAKSNADYATTFYNTNIEDITLHVPAASISAYQAVEPWKNFKEIVALKDQENMAYRPMIEDGKVWKVGRITGISDNPVKVVEYYYFDGDTIINGKTCKQMMCQRYINPDIPEYDYWTQFPSLSYVGAWYEEDKKVYLYDEEIQSMKIMYDFSLNENDIIDFVVVEIDQPPYLGPKQTGGIEGFKGVYRDLLMVHNVYNTTWLDGVGGIDGPTKNGYFGYEERPLLMSCTVGDEVIYLNDKYEDGATPMDAEAKKHRFDFTHTIKTKPKARTREDNVETLYGEYNNQLLDIRLNPLDDTYLVRITNESEQVVYEKNVNAGNIVGLNIDISAFAKGRYTVTMENSSEVFTGEFETITTGIKELKNSRIEKLKSIYNLQGQRLNRLQKGLNIVNGRKVFVQ